jgi:UDP-glucose 4-epimerase
MKMRILVTGGAGFIGSSTVKLLCDSCYGVIVFDNLSWGYREFVDKRATFIKGDLLDARSIAFALKGVDRVFHFAATSIIKRSIDDPVGCFTNNINGLINLLEGMRKNKVDYIVSSSSASVYGEPEVIPVTEDSRKAPMQPYGASKLAAEAVLSGYYHSYGINSTSLRYFNAYGPRDEQIPITRAVPRWIKATLHGDPITLYWKGMQLRDYVFVDDIAQAHIDVMDLKGCNYFNIGTGKGVIMKELLENIFETVGKRTKVLDLGKRLGDPHKLIADTSKIRHAVGWKPKVNLAKGIKITVDYYKNNKPPNGRVRKVSKES